MKSIAVYCGSSAGSNPIYIEKAFDLGKYLAISNIQLIYGGAKVGLMGAVADGALSLNGKVIGILPRFLAAKEIKHDGLTELKLVDTMHERKALMYERSEGFIALPGGFGTMEELFEMLTWAQLGHHQKPIGILNVNGFYDHLSTQIQIMVDEGFLKADYQSMLIIDTEISNLIDKMKNYSAPKVEKWIVKEEI